MAEEHYRALVVEDDPDAAQFVQITLERHAGMSVVVAGDAPTALAALEAEPFDLIVSDIELPGMSGLQMLPRAKELAPGVPVMMLTAFGRVDYAVDALRQHVDEFLTKPVMVATLVERALDLAREGRRRRAAAAVPAVVLALGAHPDDVEIGVGGTLAAHHAAGDRITILTLSGGAIGGGAQIRHEESLAAAAMVGATLIHLDFEDTQLRPASSVISAIEEAVGEVGPDRIYAHSQHDRHQDHRAVHEAVQVAARQVPNLACYQSPSSTVHFQPNQFVDIEPFIDTKLRMLAAHRSQESRDYMAGDFVRAAARYWSRFVEGVSYVEPLEVIRSSITLVSSTPVGEPAADHAAG
jgi:LmbE family N-acetylglucosaminyl deacetylase/ActR/RegA family two-component response regulator